MGGERWRHYSVVQVVPLLGQARCVCPLPERPCQSSPAGGLNQSVTRGGGGEVRLGRGGGRVKEIQGDENKCVFGLLEQC